MPSLYLKVSFVFLLSFLVLLLIAAIRYFVIFNNYEDYYNIEGISSTVLLFATTVPYFLIATFISYLNVQKYKNNTLFFLILFLGIIPAIFILYIFLRTLV